MRVAIVSLLLCLPALIASPQDDVKAAEMAWIEGVTKNDFSKLEHVLADDLYYLHSTGSADTKASYIESMRSGRQKYAAIKVNDLKIRVYGNAAVVNGDANFDFVTAGKPGKGHLKYTHVFVKNAKGWQLVSHQSLRLPE
jgi:ketosteroid isomerase-like protein